MAKFTIDLEKMMTCGWFITVDVERSRIDCTFLVIVNPVLEDSIERGLVKATTTKDVYDLLISQNQHGLSPTSLISLEKILLQKI